MNNCKLLIFDVDGTIADTDMMLIKTYETLYHLYGTKHESVDPNKIKQFSGPPIRDTLTKEFPNREYGFMLQEYRKYSRPNYVKYVKTFPYCKEVLIKLKKEGFVLAIATSKMHDATLYTLNLLKLNNIFDYLCCSDDVKKPKPDKETIDKLCSMSNIGKENAIMIGDSKYDVYTAKNANIKSVIMKFMDRKLPDDAIPSYYCNNFLELYTLITGKKYD